MTEPLISVGILSSKEIRFDLYGEFISENLDKKLSGRFKAKFENNQIKIFHDKHEILSGSEIIFTPKDIETDSFLLRDVVIGKNFHWEKKLNQRFRGSVKFIIEGEELTAVNILPLEEYLISVISSEMNSRSSLQLLKAHAIVSRGWLLSQIDKKNKNAVNEVINENEIIRWYDREEHLNYDFCADDHCQRYQGVTRIVNETAADAVSETRGLVLTSDNIICDTRYSKCCGGMTESFENVWENVSYPYLVSVIDYKFEPDGADIDLRKEKEATRWIQRNPNAYCNTSDEKVLSQILVDFDRSTKDFFRWSIIYSQDEISELINRKSGIDFGKIIDLIPLERGGSGRLIKLKIVGSKKVITIGKELEIRRTLSQSHLYSSAFLVEKENIIEGIPQKFTLIGAGWGHGVGLCQIGAAVMGELGYSFDEILKHYFKGTTIQRIF
ncbi:MAG: amidase [Ignavibacteriae bacterium HGW-Ignavibacteriae-3]|nr:MAG: amidase [Ignavibacteriae bacterium HGW-Ignavibacteriae-3]